MNMLSTLFAVSDVIMIIFSMLDDRDIYAFDSCSRLIHDTLRLDDRKIIKRISYSIAREKSLELVFHGAQVNIGTIKLYHGHFKLIKHHYDKKGSDEQLGDTNLAERVRSDFVPQVRNNKVVTDFADRQANLANRNGKSVTDRT